MNRWATGILLVSVVLLAGCTGGGGGNGAQADGGGGAQTTASCDTVDSETHTVTYSSSGFSPATITIQRCDTVRWESQGPSMWVASDRHPTHTQYDGTNVDQHCPGGDAFDQCGTGSTYSFTFSKTGEWGYHNHVRAADGGTVVVESNQ